MNDVKNNEARARLLTEAGRVVKILKELEPFDMLERSDKHPDKVRESSAGRMYRQYMTMLIQIVKALDTGSDGGAETSPLREFIASRSGR